MKGVSLKLDEGVYEGTERLVRRLKLSRNAYLNQAVGYYNRLQERHLFAQRLQAESRLVQAESRAVLREFERLPEELS